MRGSEASGLRESVVAIAAGAGLVGVSMLALATAVCLVLIGPPAASRSDTARLEGSGARPMAFSIAPAAAAVAGRARTAAPARIARAPTRAPGLTEADFRRAVNARMAAIRGCYERSLRTHGVRSGRVTVRLRIEGTGVVSGAKAEDRSLGDRTVVACVERVARTLRFPPAGGDPVSYSFPLLFDSGRTERP